MFIIFYTASLFCSSVKTFSSNTEITRCLESSQFSACRHYRLVSTLRESKEIQSLVDKILLTESFTINVVDN